MTWIRKLKYCDDFQCPQFEVDECKLGFNIQFRLPKSVADAVYFNWGCIMPRVCKYKHTTKRRGKNGI